MSGEQWLIHRGQRIATGNQSCRICGEPAVYGTVRQFFPIGWDGNLSCWRKTYLAHALFDTQELDTFGISSIAHGACKGHDVTTDEITQTVRREMSTPDCSSFELKDCEYLENYKNSLQEWGEPPNHTPYNHDDIIIEKDDLDCYERNCPDYSGGDAVSGFEEKDLDEIVTIADYGGPTPELSNFADGWYDGDTDPTTGAYFNARYGGTITETANYGWWISWGWGAHPNTPEGQGATICGILPATWWRYERHRCGIRLSEEELFSHLTERAKDSNGACNFFPGSSEREDTYLFPLAQGDRNPWDSRGCLGTCLDQPGFLDHGHFYGQGIFRGRDGGGEENLSAKGCVKFHWGITAAHQGPRDIRKASAAKYKIIVPYTSTRPGLEMYVTWKIVRRQNKGRVYAVDQAIEGEGGTAAVEEWSRTIKVSSAMSDPQDATGNLGAEDDSWNSLSWEIESEGLEVEGGPGEESEESRAKYKFVALGKQAATAKWTVEYLDSEDEVVDAAEMSVELIDGETPEQWLANAAESVKVRLTEMKVVMTGDGEEVELERKQKGGWLLYVKRRTGVWGYAELHDESDPPVFYTERRTTFLHTINGGSGPCEGCPDQVLHLTETQTVLEYLEGGQFKSLVEKDESVTPAIMDGETIIQPEVKLRWGREVYAEGLNNPNPTDVMPPPNPPGKPSGRPDWYWPRGISPNDSENPLYVPDPYVNTTYQSKTEVWNKDTRVYGEGESKRRLCGALLPTEPDPKGAVLKQDVGTEEEPDLRDYVKAASTTIDAHDSTSIMRLVAQPAGTGDFCIDYGNLEIGSGLISTAANAGARAALLHAQSGEGGCAGVYPGAKIHQTDNNTFWRYIGIDSETGEPIAPCAATGPNSWEQLFYKATGEQFMYTPEHGTYWIEDIEATLCAVEEEEEGEPEE